jgi:CRP-like cAMP-binding protein
VKKEIEQLKKLNFFSEFDNHIAEKIINSSDIKEFRVKEVIIEEHQELSEIYILIEGRVILGINTPQKGRINLNTIHPGQLFSWSAMFPPHISTASAIATQPVKVLATKAAKLMQMIEDSPAFGYKFMSIISHTLSQRLSDTRLQLVNIISL